MAKAKTTKRTTKRKPAIDKLTPAEKLEYTLAEKRFQQQELEKMTLCLECEQADKWARIATTFLKSGMEKRECSRKFRGLCVILTDAVDRHRIFDPASFINLQSELTRALFRPAVDTYNRYVTRLFQEAYKYLPRRAFHEELQSAVSLPNIPAFIIPPPDWQSEESEARTIEANNENRTLCPARVIVENFEVSRNTLGRHRREGKIKGCLPENAGITTPYRYDINEIARQYNRRKK